MARATWWATYRVRRQIARQVLEQRLGWPPNEFELAFLLSCVGTGILTLIGVSQSRSLNESLSHSFVVAWSVILACGALLALVGIYWRGVLITGLKIKRLGLFTCGLALAAYALAVMRLGSAGVGVSLFMACHSYAALHRSALITYRLRKLLRSEPPEE